ncbi:MAG: serine/threonine-protein kinase [Acidobacteriota bacterium]
MAPGTPTKLGRYEIVDEIGKGAMGVVYLAKDPLIGRLVALKTFRAGYAIKDDELQQFRTRFIREAQSAGILSHPNIVTIHDVVDSSDEGATFIAMEYIRGTNLKELLQSDQHITLAFAVDVVSQVASALDYAHSKGVVHRDIKPANILITPDNRVKLTDFGIARMNTSNLTHEGQLLGTPNYMAPEQILGKDIDHRADVFSLGVVFYEMLTRRKPFQGENLTVVTHRIVYDAFTPPEQHVSGITPQVNAALHRALEKDPNRRFQHAGEMAEELKRTLPVSGDDTSATQDIAEFVPRPAPPPASWWSRLFAVPKSEPQGAGSPSPTLTVTPEQSARRARQARLVVTVFAGLAALLVAGLGAMFALQPPATSSPTLPGGARAAAASATGAASADLDRLRYDGLLQQAQAALQRGDGVTAAQLATQAESLVSDPTAARALLAEALRKATDQQQSALRAQQISTGLASAHTAMEQKRYEEARSMALSVLALAPDQAEAKSLVADAEGAMARKRAPVQHAQTAPVLASEPAPAAPPAAPALLVGPPAASAADSVLVIDFYSDAPEGIVTIYAGERQVLRQSFHFFKKTGMFKSEAMSGTIAARRHLPAGSTSLRVYLALGDRPAQVTNLDGNFLSGRERVLKIRVSKDGQVQASLN